MSKKPDARGGNSDVYFDEENNTAIKKLRNTSSKLNIERFKQEQNALQVIAEQNIPNIVEVTKINIDEKNINNSFIEMKKYDGSLYKLFPVTRGNVRKSLELILPIIKALKRLAENDPIIIHRDLKPDNILYLQKDDFYELYLADFGICFLFDDNERLTPNDMAVGARMFIAPEYEIGRVESITAKGDIFSIGKIIWCMINGDTQALLPSNFWFVDSFDLQNIFPSDRDMISANLVIASCLAINPDERIDYENLIALIESIIVSKEYISTHENELKVKLYQEKRKIEFAEILKKNKILVNKFSLVYLEALGDINSTYSNFELTQILADEYSKKSLDGVDFTTTNIDDCSSHYLYSRSFDNIYLAVDYNPPIKGDTYANITFRYTINSSNNREKVKIKYNTNNNLIIELNNESKPLSKKSLIDFLNRMVINYCES